MKLTISNIGAITKASIELADITVIAGENDSGKSTIGKVFFALIQAFSNYPILLQNERREYIRREIERIFFDVRRNFDIAQHPEIREVFGNTRILQRMEFLDDAILIQISELLDHLYEISQEQTQRQILIQRSKIRLSKLKDYIKIEFSEIEAISGSIFKALQSEFSGEIVNKSQSNCAEISLADGETTIFNLLLDDNAVIKFEGGDSIGFDDATFVDGPAVIQYHNAMRGYNPLGQSQYFPGSMPFHTLDLSQKLSIGNHGLFGIDKQVSFNLGDTYKGKIFFDREEKNFFLDKGGYRVSANNIASGVKSMGVLDMLIEGGFVKDGTLLILDEPETNLHPKWQIEYAKILCKLATNGAKILITTHSPYMVEALKEYSSNLDISGNFYLSWRSKDNEIEYMNATSNIAPIIQALSEPLADLISGADDEF